MKINRIFFVVPEETSDDSDFWLLNMATAKKRELRKRDT